MRITKLLGELDGLKITRTEVALRKSNKVKTIQASLAIEGNTLSIKQVTAVLDETPVIAPEKYIIEAKNAIEVYDNISNFRYSSLIDFKKAHKQPLKGFNNDAGQFRISNVGVYAGSRVAHVAPQPKMVDVLMENLFSFLKKKDDTSLLIKL